MRSETTTSMDDETYETTAIIKGDVVYISGQQGMGMGMDEDCDWVKMDNARLAECIPESDEPMAAETDTYDYEDTYETAPSEYNCDYATFGDEKFDTPGKVCDLTEEMCSLYEMADSGTFPGMGELDPSICEGLEGQDYADCMEAISQYR